MIINLRTAGSEINIYVVKGVLAGLIRSNITKYGAFLDFPVTWCWVRSLYGRMKFSRRASTTSRPAITRSVWEEAKEQYLHNIASKVSEHNIPNELILNADQTQSKYVSTSKVTMAETGKKNVYFPSFPPPPPRRPFSPTTSIEIINNCKYLCFHSYLFDSITFSWAENK